MTQMPQPYPRHGGRGPAGRLGRSVAALVASVPLLLAPLAQAATGEAVPGKPEGALRVATFNANLVRQGAGVLIKDIAKRDPQVLAVAEILLRVRPDIVLLNEIDHDPEGGALGRLAGLLAEGVAGLPGLDYPHRFTAEPNTGVPSRHDLDGDGRTMGPGDALGFGRFPGQYGMAVLSRLPLGPARTFRTLPWAAVPGAEPPLNPDGTPFWPDEVWRTLPLSSKSHWDVPVSLPGGAELHLLASHPTPPVFDGPEDRNGLRNAAEISFWAEYLDGTAFPDDAGETAALAPEARVVVLGDLNLDPADGDGHREAIRRLLGHARLQDPRPASAGGAAAAAQGGANAGQAGDPALDTADFRDDAPGNLRVDFVLPSRDLEVLASGVFWPAPDDPRAGLVGERKDERASSDHRLVWVDVRVPD
jgi:endonuclease/exonuclease/phosphatase family metal-dependent hydrolase